jgi:hypothetical protein
MLSFIFNSTPTFLGSSAVLSPCAISDLANNTVCDALFNSGVAFHNSSGVFPF